MDAAKANARFNKSDMESLKAIHDHAVKMGADCPMQPAAGEKKAARRNSQADQDRIQAMHDHAADMMGNMHDPDNDGDDDTTAAGDTDHDYAGKADTGVPGDYLVVEDERKPSTWHLRVKRNGVPDHGLMGAAFAALHEGYRGNTYDGPNKQEALQKLIALYKQEKMELPGAEKDAPKPKRKKPNGGDDHDPIGDDYEGDPADDGSLGARKSLYAVKALDSSGKIGAYAVLFGTPETPDVSPARDYFTKNTDFWLDKWGLSNGKGQVPIIYDHAQDPATADMPVVGAWTKAVIHDAGVWLEGQLDQAHQYAAAIQTLISKGVLALSSDSTSHLVKRKPQPNGTNEIVRWPLIAASLTTHPCEPRLLPVAQIKAAYKAIGIDYTIPDAEPSEAQPGTEVKGAEATAHRIAELEQRVDKLARLIDILNH